MATSRTGTAAYQHWRRRVLAAGRADGVTRCPGCGVELDYEHGRRPDSAEPDHILPHKWGGRDVVEGAVQDVQHQAGRRQAHRAARTEIGNNRFRMVTGVPD